jgi:putative ABC transport system permease protein
VKRLLSIVLTLLSYWRKRPVHLATTLVGLVAATALWSGVQALNHQARNSYERAAAIFGGDQIRMLVSRDGPTFSQDLYIRLRLAGWRVSPVLEGRVQIAGKSLQLVGIEPVTLPREANLRSIKNSDAHLARAIPTFTEPVELLRRRARSFVWFRLNRKRSSLCG